MPSISDFFTSALGGVAAALLAALMWAFATMLFARLSQSLRVLEINLLKCILAGLLSVGLLYLSGGSLAGIPFRAVWVLALSGFLGITLGDTTYLQAVKYIGPRQALLLSTLAPPITGLIAWVFLGEALPWQAWVGIIVTVAGVAWVITERSGTRQPIRDLRLGVLFGALAALGQSVAVVLSRAILTETSVGPLASSVVRLFAGTFTLLVWLLVMGQPLISLDTFRTTRDLWKILLASTVLGTFLAMWMQQVAVSLAPAGVTQTLLSTSPIFILPMAAVSGEKLTWRAVLGALIALGGVWLLIMITG